MSNQSQKKKIDLAKLHSLSLRKDLSKKDRAKLEELEKKTIRYTDRESDDSEEESMDNAYMRQNRIREDETLKEFISDFSNETIDHSGNEDDDNDSDNDSGIDSFIHSLIKLTNHRII